MKLTPEKLNAIISSAKQSLRDSGFNEEDLTIGLSILSYLLEAFNRPFITLANNDVEVILWPTNDIKFVEVLRVYANILEIKINEDKEN